MASVALALFNGENLIELVAYHRAIGILNALVLAPIGALIVVGDRRHLLAWLLLVDSLALATFNFTEQCAALALGLTPRRLSLPGGDLSSWTNLPGIVISVVFLVLLFPDGRLPARRWWPPMFENLDTLSAELLATVDQTMRPAAVSLWLRPSAADRAPFARGPVGLRGGHG